MGASQRFYVLLVLFLAGVHPAAGAPAVSGKVFLFRKKLQFSETVWPIDPTPTAWENVSAGDFNGDGRDDLITHDSSTNMLQVALAAANGFRTTKHAIQSNNSSLNPLWSTAEAFDVDADGISELVVLDETRANVLLVRDDGRSTYIVSTLFSFDRVPHIQRALFADDSCDGNPDLFLQYSRNLYAYRFAANDKLQFPSTVQISSNGLLIGAGKFRNTHCGSPTFYNSEEKTLTSVLDRTKQWGAQLPIQSLFLGFLFGDFNGDGYDEILLRADNLFFPWWAIISNSRHFIEVSVELPSLAANNFAWIVSGDFDGNGADDIAYQTNNGSGVQLLLAELGPGLPGVTVTSENGGSAVSDQDGKYTLENLPSGTVEIKATSDQYYSRTKLRTVRLANEKIETVHFAFVSETSEDQQPGRLTGFGPPPQGPYICTGYTAEYYARKWGRYPMCADGYALYTMQDPRGLLTTAAQVQADGTCCKLPKDDILLDDHVMAAHTCPDGYVVTGGTHLWGDCHDDECLREIRCTKINDARYQLGPPTPGQHWGLGASSFFEDQNRLSVGKIPAAMRPGLGKGSVGAEHDRDGCIGNPPGSLLTAKGARKCKNLTFRELQYKGVKGDPSKGTAVQMYPGCRHLQNPLDPTKGCRQ